MEKGRTYTLKIWRQPNAETKGAFKIFKVEDISPGTSFLEMLDILNEQLSEKDEDPVHFDHDCREGICGMCSLFINGRPHGPDEEITVCQLHMRVFPDGSKITIEPWRATAFPVIKDLIVDRTAFDRIVQAGGFISVNTGAASDANAIPIPKNNADLSMDAASCIGCGACVAVCKNASAMLFTAAKISQLALLPQGHVERKERAKKMVAQMDIEGFGACTNTGACSAECPKGIDLSVIALMNREYFTAQLTT
jgi:succinate dehydrogenase / fumarate reductase iron-sulfur subunit